MDNLPNGHLTAWSDCPFFKGKVYRVKKDFQAMRDTFKEGELLVFEREAWSRYDGITGYFFHNHGTESHGRMWDIYDSESVKALWGDLFEEVKA